MGFTQLLAANRSLRNINSGPSRYKMNQANLLPKFGMERSAKAESITAPAAPVLPAPVEEIIPPAAPVTPGAESPGAIATQEALPQSLNSQSPVSSRLPSWLRFRNPFGALGRKAESTAPVQTELLLDTVKPVRNQLGDEELTLKDRVNKPTTATPLSSPFASASARPVDDRGLWRRWTNRVFGGRNRP